MTHINQRRDQSAIWTSVNPILMDGEAGHESDTGKWKLGNGTDPWVDLPYKAAVDSVAGKTGVVTLVVADVTGAAPLASPALTGNPTAPTPPTADDDTSVATTAYVKAQFADTVLTGNPTAPTPSLSDDDTSIATTAFVQGLTLRNTIFVDDAGDLPAGPFLKRQRAVTLDTGIDYFWNGTVWVADVAQVDCANNFGTGTSTVFRRGRSAVIAVDYTPTQDIAAFSKILGIPDTEFRPLTVIHGTVYNNDTSEAVEFYVEANGDITTRSIMLDGHLFLGSITIPLPA